MRPESIVRTTSATLEAARQHFKKEDTDEVLAPRISGIAGACEDPGILFPVEYYGRRGYLSQTAQPFLELAVQMLGRAVFSIARCFRCEAPESERHLAEFTHIEAEYPDASLDEVLDRADGVLDAMWRASSSPGDGRDFSKPKRTTFRAAVAALREHGREVSVGDELSPDDERLLAELLGPVYVTHHPSANRHFAIRRSAEDEGCALSADLIAPGVGEVLGLGVRESNIDRLRAAFVKGPQLEHVRRLGLDADAYDWYFEMKENGGLATAGFGLGLERFLMWRLSIDSIRSVTLFPRTAQCRLNP